jgi:ribonuclease BN (tRNA processing enzyme)
MKIIFAGVGEAFDERLANTSILCITQGRHAGNQILLDCGFTAAHAFWAASPDPLHLDAVWISHFHGDHFMGLPLLLLRSWEEGRTKPLTIVGRPGVERACLGAMDLSYPGFLPRIEYPIRFVEAHPGKDEHLAGCYWSFAENGHTEPCLALRLESEGRSVFYSGDGKPTSQTLSLAMEVDLIIHEAYMLETEKPGHGSVDSCVRFAVNAGARALALVHMNRKERRTRGEEVRKRLAKAALKAVLPEPGEAYTID